MKISYYFYIFIIIISFLAFIFFPQNTELIYVYQKAGDYKSLSKIYKRTLKRQYSKDIHKKYINTLMKLNSPLLAKEAVKYIKRYHDIKLLNKVINYTLSKKDYKNYTELLNQGFLLTGKVKYLQKLIDFYSFKHKRKELIFTLKKAYNFTKNQKFLYALYNLGEKKFVINIFLQNIDNLSSKEINLVKAFYLENKDYNNYLNFLDSLYSKTKNFSYLIEKMNLLSFLHRQKELIATLKKLYKLTKNIKYLDTIYALGDKKFTISEYEKNIKNLNREQLSQLYKYYLWNGKFKKVISLIKNYIGFDNLTLEEEKEYVGLLTYYAKDKELINFYKKKYSTTHKIKFLIKLADAYDYYGYPQKAAKVYFKIFTLTHREKYIDKIISIYLALGDYNNFLKYSLIKLKNFYSDKLLKETVSLLINLNKFDKAVKLTEKYINRSPELFHFLATLYFSINAPQKALNLLLKYPPEKLTKSELSFVATSKKISPELFPYLISYYKITKEKYFIDRILKFYAEKGAFYKYNRLFKRFYGKIDEKNYLKYFELIPDRFKKFKIDEAKRLIIASFNIKLINNLSMYLMGENEQIASMKGFKKVLFFDKNNLTALEQLGKIYYWQKNFSKALKIFLKYNHLNPYNPIINFYIGDILYNKKFYKKAKKYFNFVVKNIKKDSLENRMIYLKAYVYLHGINDVINEYREVVKESGYNRDVYADFIDALYFSHRYDLLEKEYKKFKKMGEKYTKFIRLLRLFAAYYIDIGEFKKAKMLLDKALAIIKKYKIKNSAIYADYGYLYYSESNRVKALKYYQKAHKVNPKNRDISYTIDELKDFLHRNITISTSVKNRVHAKRVTLNIPVNNKYWLGVSYNQYDNKKTEIYFKFQDINKTKYLFEFGKNYFNVNLGHFYKFFLKKALYTAYEDAIKESMKEIKIGFSMEKNLRKFNNSSINLNISKNLYKNKHGKVASTFNVDTSLSYPLKNDTYLITGFSYVKTGYYNSKKSNVFFDDYRAINFFITKYFQKERRKFNWDITVGTVYDLISSKYNYAGSFNLNYNKNINFEYNLYYDTFSKEQVEMWQFNWRIKF